MGPNSFCNDSVCVCDRVCVCETKCECCFYVCVWSFSPCSPWILITSLMSSLESQYCELCHHVQVYMFFQKVVEEQDSGGADGPHTWKQQKHPPPSSVNEYCKSPGEIKANSSQSGRIFGIYTSKLRIFHFKGSRAITHDSFLLLLFFSPRPALEQQDGCWMFLFFTLKSWMQIKELLVNTALTAQYIQHRWKMRRRALGSLLALDLFKLICTFLNQLWGLLLSQRPWR